MLHGFQQLVTSSRHVKVSSGKRQLLQNCVHALLQSCPTLCDSMHCSLPGSSVSCSAGRFSTAEPWGKHRPCWRLNTSTQRRESLPSCSHLSLHFISTSISEEGFSSGSAIKKIHLQCRRPMFDPWVGKIPWRRKWQPPLVFLPGKSQGQKSLVGYSA